MRHNQTGIRCTFASDTPVALPIDRTDQRVRPGCGWGRPADDGAVAVVPTFGGPIRLQRSHFFARRSCWSRAADPLFMPVSLHLTNLVRRRSSPPLSQSVLGLAVATMLCPRRGGRRASTLRLHEAQFAIGRVAEAVKPLEHSVKVAPPFVPLGLAEIGPVVTGRGHGSQSRAASPRKLRPVATLPFASVGGIIIVRLDR